MYAFLGWIRGTTMRASSLTGVLATNTQWSPTTSMSLIVVPGSGANKETQESIDGSETGA